MAKLSQAVGERAFSVVRAKLLCFISLAETGLVVGAVSERRIAEATYMSKSVGVKVEKSTS